MLVINVLISSTAFSPIDERGDTKTVPPIERISASGSHACGGPLHMFLVLALLREWAVSGK